MDLETIIIEPQEKAQYSIIWMHGLGADGNDFVPIVPMLQLSNDPVRFIFPHAPMQAVAINQNMIMRAWFNIFEIKLGAREDTTGILQSAKLIEKLIAAEIEKGVPAQHIFLVGFSQGGAMALHTGLLYQESLAGIAGLSCFLPMHQQFPQQRAAANFRTPIFLAHGTLDPIVPIFLGQGTKYLLENQGYQVQWHQYPMPHQVCPEEISDLSAFFKRSIRP